MVTKVTNDVLADDAVTTNNIANSAITSTKIANGAITGTAIANNSIDGTKIALGSDTRGDLMIYGASNWKRLPAGTAGYVLETQGAGLDPVWAAPATWGGTESAAANGYVTFPAGIKLQWGVSASIAQDVSGAVTFPSAFTTAVYSIIITPIGAINTTSAGADSVTSVTVNGFTIAHGGDGARTFYYQAIGK